MEPQVELELSGSLNHLEATMQFRYGATLRGIDEEGTVVVQGEEDEFGSGERVSALVADLGMHITLVRIPGSDHYFTDRLDELRETVRGYYESGPGSRYLAAV